MTEAPLPRLSKFLARRCEEFSFFGAVEAGSFPRRREFGRCLRTRRETGQRSDFQGSFPYEQKPAFENKGILRLKFLPWSSDIFHVAREIQVERRNDF
jgi:hypothetical protein